MNFYKNYYKLILSVLLLLVISAPSIAQQDESWKIYDDSQVARVDITIDPSALEWIYQNVQSDSEFVAKFHFQNAHINETVDSIGFRLRGNTSRDAQKKSFKVSFNTFFPGREFYGVDKLNLNGEHNDPSIIRSKLCFDHFQTIGMKASRASHAEVYINGQYYGLYISVEHIDDEFLNKNFNNDSGNLWKCLYPADLVYLGSDPNLYKNLNNNGRPAYELTTNEEQGDFTKLVKLITTLKNSASLSLVDSLESILDVPSVLKYFAMNILFGEWDDYWSLMNNYYLYHEPGEDKIYLIPYDYDNTLGIDWFGINWTNANPYNFPKVVSGSRPLAEKIMQNPEYRNLYTHFLEFFRSNIYDLNLWTNRLDSLRQRITTSALNDNYRTLDYGFDINDFFNSYAESGYSKDHVKYGLKEFVNLRNASLPSQLSYQSAKPIVYRIDYLPENPGPNDTIKVYASVFDSDGLSEVSIHIQKNDLPTEIISMNFSPIINSKIIEESDRWIGIIPPLGNNAVAKFFISAKDNFNQFQFYPRKKAVEIITPQIITNDIVINEFMADNSTSISDQNGEFDDWIELYNPTSSPINLSGRYLTDKKDNLTKYKFTQPNLILNPNEFLLIWCDEQGSQQGIHTNFKLSKDGEFIALVETDGVSVIDSISFGPQQTDMSFGRYGDGNDSWVFMSPTPGTTNNIVSVNDDEIIPSEFSLTAYPNPFNPATTILYVIPNEVRNLKDFSSQGPRNDNTMVSLKVYDILGNELITLVDQEKPAGSYEVIWDGENAFGNKVSSGIYFARLSVNQKFKNIKLMLLK